MAAYDLPPFTPLTTLTGTGQAYLEFGNPLLQQSPSALSHLRGLQYASRERRAATVRVQIDTEGRAQPTDSVHLILVTAELAVVDALGEFLTGNLQLESIMEMIERIAEMRQNAITQADVLLGTISVSPAVLVDQQQLLINPPPPPAENTLLPEDVETMNPDIMTPTPIGIEVIQID